MARFRHWDLMKLYKIYLRCKTHSWPPYEVTTFRKFFNIYDSIIDICERERKWNQIPRKPLTEKETALIKYNLDHGAIKSNIPKLTWITRHRMVKYFE